MSRRVRMRIPITCAALMLAGSLVFAQDIRAQDVRIGVLGLFHTRQFALSAGAGSALVVQAGQESLVLEKSSGMDIIHIRAFGNSVLLRSGTHVIKSSKLTATGRGNGPVDFILAVPGKITRHYRGTLEIKSVSGALTAVVNMDLETAVASVVAAESTPGTPLEALKAQAVAARSYFVAGNGRHHEFDFCDTTHCQFLREPPDPATAASKAVFATRGLVIAYQSEPVAAMYTRSCSGRTRTPAELGLPTANYPYYAVDCKYCREHPPRWQSRISSQDAAALHSSDESARLRIDRRLGWSAVPSDNFIMQKEGERFILQGTGQGHGIGLCQSGAKAMAEEGADFHLILTHYYPNTTIKSLESVTASFR
jgi:peptidoglycan hydrolase-like amidase